MVNMGKFVVIKTLTFFLHRERYSLCTDNMGLGKMVNLNIVVGKLCLNADDTLERTCSLGATGWNALGSIYNAVSGRFIKRVNEEEDIDSDNDL